MSYIELIIELVIYHQELVRDYIMMGPRLPEQLARDAVCPLRFPPNPLPVIVMHLF